MNETFKSKNQEIADYLSGSESCLKNFKLILHVISGHFPTKWNNLDLCSDHNLEINLLKLFNVGSSWKYVFWVKLENNTGSNVWDYFTADILHPRDLLLFKILVSLK